MTLSVRGLVALVVVVILFIVGIVAFGALTDNIKPGYVGYIYDRTLSPEDSRAIPGTSVHATPRYGFVWINPWTQEVLKYPTTIVSRSWTKAKEEGSPKDESFQAATLEGQNLTCDAYLSVQPNDVGLIIKNWGARDFETIVDKELFGLMKGIVQQYTQSVSIYDFQSKRSTLTTDITKALDDMLLKTYGVKLQRFQFGEVTPPPEIQAKINEKVQAINEVELAELARQKQDKVNQQSVDKQIADSKVTLTKRQQDADAAAYEVMKQADAQKTAAEAKYEAAKLEKAAELERQQTYTEAYLANKSLDVQREIGSKIAADTKIIIDNGSGSGIGAIPGIKAILDEINKPSK